MPFTGKFSTSCGCSKFTTRRIVRVWVGQWIDLIPASFLYFSDTFRGDPPNQNLVRSFVRTFSGSRDTYGAIAFTLSNPLTIRDRDENLPELPVNLITTRGAYHIRHDTIIGYTIVSFQPADKYSITFEFQTSGTPQGGFSQPGIRTLVWDREFTKAEFCAIIDADMAGDGCPVVPAYLESLQYPFPELPNYQPYPTVCAETDNAPIPIIVGKSVVFAPTSAGVHAYGSGTVTSVEVFEPGFHSILWDGDGCENFEVGDDRCGVSVIIAPEPGTENSRGVIRLNQVCP
jgi:hypothetical protein